MMPNTGPILTAVGQALYSTVSPLHVFTSVTIADAELDLLNGGDGNYDGATFHLVRAGGQSQQDEFDFSFTHLASANWSVVNNEIRMNTIRIASFSNTASGITITFEDISTPPTTILVNEILSALTYRFDATEATGAGGSLDIQLQASFTDGGAEAITANQFIDVEIYAPTQSAIPQYFLPRGGSSLLTASALGVSDQDSGAATIFFEASASDPIIYLLNGNASTTFTLADVVAGLVQFLVPAASGNAVQDFDVILSTLMMGNDANNLDQTALLQITPPLPAPHLEANDDTGTLGDGITATSIDLTFTGASQGILLDTMFDSGRSYLFSSQRNDGLDNDSDGTTDEQDEVTQLAFDGQSYSGETFSFNADLAPGTYDLFIRFETELGGVPTRDTATFELTIAPETTRPNLVPGDDSGLSSSDDITNISTGLTFTGTSQSAGQTIRLFEVVRSSPDGIDNDSNGLVDDAAEMTTTTTLIGTTTSGIGGAWTVNLNLAEGEHQISAAVGNGPVTAPTKVIVDQTAATLQSTVISSGELAIFCLDVATSLGDFEIGDFKVLVDGVERAIQSMQVADPLTPSSLIVTFAAPIQKNQVVQVIYDAEAGGNNSLRDTADNAIASATISATNSSEIDITAPTIVKAHIGPFGTIVLQYSEAIDQTASFETGDFAVTINGQSIALQAVGTGLILPFLPTGIPLENCLILQPTTTIPVITSGSVTYSRTAGTDNTIVDVATLPSGANSALNQTIAISLNTAISFTNLTKSVVYNEDALPPTVPQATTGASLANDADPFNNVSASSTFVDAAVHGLNGATTAITSAPFGLSPQAVTATSGTGLQVDWVNTGLTATSVKHLNDGEFLLVRYDLTVNDQAGSTSTQRITFRVNGANEIINGTSDDDTKNGSIFGDTINGLAGDDILNGNSSADKVFGGDGDDTLNGGSGNDQLEGGNHSDVLNGGSGDDKLNGGTGADQNFGGSGNDVYLVDASDTIIEYLDSGTDKVQSAGSWTLGANLENLTLSGTGNKNGTGNAAVNTLTGNIGNNTLKGLGGADALIGGSGADTLIGGTGIDILSGGSGADKFRFDALSEVGDIVSGFSSIDFIVLKGATFGGLSAGSVAAGRFISRATSNEALDTSDLFIFRQSDDTLWYDSNGSTSGGTKVMIVDLSNFSLLVGDIQII